MVAGFYAQSALLVLPIVSMVIFMVLFVALAGRALWRRNQPGLNTTLSQLPLRDEERPVPAAPGGLHV